MPCETRVWGGPRGHRQFEWRGADRVVPERELGERGGALEQEIGVREQQRVDQSARPCDGMW